jgi:DNA-binding NtrC family response regulator
MSKEWRVSLNAALGGVAERQRLGDYLQICERDYIRLTLGECSGRICETASLLGISRKSLWHKMRKLTMNEESTNQRGSEQACLP